MNRLLLIKLFLMIFPGLWAQDQTVGLFTYQAGSFNGYTLFNPLRSTDTYLIDNCGRVINIWEGPFTPGNSTFLLEDGNLLRTAKTSLDANPVFAVGGAGERVQLLDWESTVLWDFVYSDDTHRMHHDIAPMPNGNVLILAWDLHTCEEVVAAGRRPELLPDSVIWSEQLIEVEPFTGEIVWEWYLWDHLIQDFDPAKANFGVVGDHPELLDINAVAGPTSDGGADWLHANAIDYNPMMDQVLINTPYLNEFYIIDHSTSTQQAAGHNGGNSNRGGDFLYRWGNPQIYDQGLPADQQLFGAHHAHWIPEGLTDEGQIMIFNNGFNRPDGNYSSVEIIVPPVDDYLPGLYVYIPGTAFLPAGPDWVYTAENPEDFFSIFISGAQRLPNGNTLICSGAHGRFFEIDPEKEIVWDYVNPETNLGPIAWNEEIPIFAGRNGNIVFRCTRYPPDYPGLAGKDLSPGEPIELDLPEPYECEIITRTSNAELPEFRVFPTPASQQLFIETEGDLRTKLVRIFDLPGRLVGSEVMEGAQLIIPAGRYPAGLYFVEVEGYGYRRALIVR